MVNFDAKQSFDVKPLKVLTLRQLKSEKFISLSIFILNYIIHNDLKRKGSSKMHRLRYVDNGEIQKYRYSCIVELVCLYFQVCVMVLWVVFTFSTACFRSPTWQRSPPRG